MHTLRFGSFTLAICVITLGVITAGMIWFGGDVANDAFANENPTIERPRVPDHHRAVMDRLREYRRFTFQETRGKACIEELSKSLKVKIRFHESTIPFTTNRPVTFDSKEAISYANALRVLLDRINLRKAGIVFDDDRLTIVMGDKYAGPTYRIHSLVGRSDISTATREREIDTLLRSVEPRSWNSESQTWIQPGESIFEIDVYHSHTVHERIRERFESLRYPMRILDEDIQILTSAQFLTDPEERQKVDTEAVVKRLRKKYPFESLTKRLAYEAGKKSDLPPRLSDEMDKHLTNMEAVFDRARKIDVSPRLVRSDSLRLLHEAEVEAFIARPGAGVGRVFPSPSYLPGNPPRNLPLASNEMVRFSDETPVNLPATKKEAAARRVFLPSEESLNQLHFRGQYRFVMPGSFGYVKTREEVAGFHSHGFVVPLPLITPITRPEHRKDKEIWAMHRLELVSLLKHEKPAVYVSRSLPNMEELSDVETRPLNGFEQMALVRLHDGEDVISKASLNRIEMIGSLRASRQCLECHEVQRGALLGAFSYELLRDPQLDPEKEQKVGSRSKQIISARDYERSVETSAIDRRH